MLNIASMFYLTAQQALGNAAQGLGDASAGIGRKDQNGNISASCWNYEPILLNDTLLESL